MPKFLIDDVIPEEGLVLRQWDQRFWIQRPFLYKNTPIWFLFYVFYNCNFRYFYVSYASKYHPKMAKGAKVTSPGSSTLHLALVCVCETLWYTQTLKSHNFIKKKFFWCGFFCSFRMTELFQITSFSKGVKILASSPLSGELWLVDFLRWCDVMPRVSSILGDNGE